MAVRLFGKLTGNAHKAQVKHYIGLPPSLTGDRDHRQKMPSAAFLLIEVNSDGTFLYRYSDKGEFAGDTWHKMIEEAKEQASEEYPDCSIQWEAIPDQIEDAVAFGINKSRMEG